LKPIPQRLIFFTSRFIASVWSVRSTRQVMDKDPSSPAPQGVAERDDLVDLIRKAAGDHAVEQHRSVIRIIGEVHVAHVLLSVIRPSRRDRHGSTKHAHEGRILAF
jgi:hypothetical protein